MNRFGEKLLSIWVPAVSAALAAVIAGWMEPRDNGIWFHKAAQEKSPEVLESISDNMGTLLTLAIKEGRFEPEICREYEPAMQAIQAMDAGRGGSGSSSGGQFWSCRRESDSRIFAAQFGSNLPPDRRDKEAGIQLGFVDKNLPGWRMSTRATPNADVRFMAFRKESAAISYIVQRSDQTLFGVAVKPEGIIAAADSTYAALVQSNPAFANDVLVAELRQWGLTGFSGRFAGPIREIMLKHFADSSTEARVAVEQIIAELSASAYETRKNASDKLEENSAQHLDLLIHAMLDSGLPPEPRVRIRKALEQALNKKQFEAFVQIESQKLIDDSELLVWLLSESSEPAVQANICERLRKITGQELGNDAEAWKSWLIASGKAVTSSSGVLPSAEPPGELPALSSPLKDRAELVASVFPLAIADGRIKLDRATLAQPYNGKSVVQLAEDLRQYARDQHLPEDWISVNPESISQGGIDYPHLAFARFEREQNKTEKDDLARMRMMHRGRTMQFLEFNSNPFIQTETYRVCLEREEGAHFIDHLHAGVNENGPDYWGFSVDDEADPENSLYIGIWDSGPTRLIATGPQSFVQIFQSANGQCRLDCAHRNQSLHREFENADALLQDTFYQEKVAGFLGQYGVTIKPASAP